MKKLISLFFSKQFLIFLVIGGVNTLNGVLFPYLFSLFLQENIAYLLSYVPSLCISYVLNSVFTFKEPLAFKKLIKFVISYLPNFIIQNLSFVVVFNILGLPKLLAILLASVIGIPLTFIILKLFAFGKKKAQ